MLFQMFFSSERFFQQLSFDAVTVQPGERYPPRPPITWGQADSFGQKKPALGGLVRLAEVTSAFAA